MKFINATIFLLAAIWFYGCEKVQQPYVKPEPQLPPITTEGNNTFGMLLNGKLWLPYMIPGVFAPELAAGYYRGKLSLVASIVSDDRSISQNFAIEIRDTSVKLDTGHIVLKSKFSPGARFTDNKTRCYYETSDSFPGNLHVIRFDTIHRIFSGTFDVVFKTPQCEDIHITEGRFDLKF